MISYHLRNQWLSMLVMINYWRRKRGLAPDKWYWADEELVRNGHYWMPCYWSWLRFMWLLTKLLR